VDLRRVLIVDDHRSFAETLGQILHDHGVEATIAVSGTEALELMRSARFDTLITDLKMNGMSGIELIREAGHVLPGLPIVVITGGDTMAARGVANEAHVLAVLPKPVPFRELLAVLDSTRVV